MTDVLAALLLIGFFVVPSIVNWLKGKRLWATIGFLSGWHWIPVFRLAKPQSWWARRYYGDEKLREATARFLKSTDLAGHAPAVAAVGDFSADDIVFEDKTTRKAWKKAQRGG